MGVVGVASAQERGAADAPLTLSGFDATLRLK
jgi:hypothetical protein